MLVKKENKEMDISGCWNQCLYFTTSMDGMECGHPYWDDKGSTYSRMIISWNENIKTGFPSKCPLLLKEKDNENE